MNNFHVDTMQKLRWIKSFINFAYFALPLSLISLIAIKVASIMNPQESLNGGSLLAYSLFFIIANVILSLSVGTIMVNRHRHHLVGKIMDEKSTAEDEVITVLVCYSVATSLLSFLFMPAGAGGPINTIIIGLIVGFSLWMIIDIDIVSGSTVSEAKEYYEVLSKEVKAKREQDKFSNKKAYQKISLFVLSEELTLEAAMSNLLLTRNKLSSMYEMDFSKNLDRTISLLEYSGDITKFDVQLNMCLPEIASLIRDNNNEEREDIISGYLVAIEKANKKTSESISVRSNDDHKAYLENIMKKVSE